MLESHGVSGLPSDAKRREGNIQWIRLLTGVCFLEDSLGSGAVSGRLGAHSELILGSLRGSGSMIWPSWALQRVAAPP
eukprot:1036992-Pyramimonas_sp.AAC.1